MSSKSEATIHPEIVKPKSWYGVRFTQIILLFLMLVIGYGIRVTLSVGIVAMTDSRVNPNFETYNWTDNSIVLSSFYWGYIIPQVVAGQIAEAFGVKWLLILTMALSSCSSIIIPLVAHYGSWAVMTCRIILGLIQAPFLPATQLTLAKWAPAPERSRISSFIYAGLPLSSGVCNSIAGSLTSSSLGWPSLFYLYAGLGFLWIVVYFILGANSPDEHKSISEEEKNYIKATQGQQKEEENIPTPWSEILTSLPFLAILISHFTENWGYTTLLTEIPSYMDYVLNYDMASNGILSSCPYLAMGLMSFVFGALADLIINREYVSITTGRKLWNAVGFVGPAILLICLAAFKNSPTGAVALLIIALGMNAACHSGFQVNHVDLSPRFSATQMALTNSFATIASILGPLSVQYIVTDQENEKQWNIVFYMAAGVYIFGATTFVIFGSTEKQSWDEGSKKYRAKKLEDPQRKRSKL